MAENENQREGEQILAQWSDRVFRLQGDTHTGSGVLCADKQILTVAHLGFKRGHNYAVMGTNQRSLSATPIYINKALDLAVLKSDNFDSVGLVCNSLRIACRYYIMGYPKNADESVPSISTGIVENFDKSENVIGSSGARPGFSGGPALNAEGTLAGIVASGLDGLSANSTFQHMFDKSWEQNNVLIMPINTIHSYVMNVPSDE